MNYLGFVRAELRFLLFGLTMMLLSNLGQTYFIGLYAPQIRSTFGLTHSGFGAIYSAITLLSAFVLFYSGPLIDRVRLSRYMAAVVIGLGVSCLLLGTAGHWLVFLVALFGVRHLGQGLSVHTAVVAVSRAYGRYRARAVSIAQLGYAGGEAVLPLLTVWLVMVVGWQGSWVFIGATLLLVGLPFLLYLSGGEPDWREQGQQGGADQVQKNRADMLRDSRFYLLLPLYTAPPFLLTGMFFHHAALAEERGWSLELLASGFLFYALCKVVCSLLAGAVVDRYSALRLFPLTALPLCLAFAVVALPDLLPAELALLAWMGLCGVCIGVIVPATGALWPELFGTLHLGAIRSLISPISIVSTAAAPILFALVLDAGLPLATLGWPCVGYLVLAAASAWFASRISPGRAEMRDVSG